MSTSFRYAEDHGAGHHVRHRTQRDIFQSSLFRTAPAPVKPLAWDDIANWRGKRVWAMYEGKRQQFVIVNTAPEGSDGERWYGMPLASHRYTQYSIPKRNLELTNPYALAIRPQAAIVVYKGA